MPKKTIPHTKGLKHRPKRSVSDDKLLLPQVETETVYDLPEPVSDETIQVKPETITLDIDRLMSPDFDILKWLESYAHRPVKIIGHADAIAHTLHTCVDDRWKEAADPAAIKKQAALNKAAEKNEKSNYLIISNEDGEQRLWIPDILFLTTIKLVEDGEKKGTRFLFRMVNGKSYIMSNTSIKHYEESLTAHPFARVSPAYLINMYGIETYKKKGGHIVMKPYFDADRKAEVREEIEIADNKRDWFDRYYHEFDGAVE